MALKDLYGKPCPTCGKEIVQVTGVCGSCVYEKYRMYNIAYKYGVPEEKYQEIYDSQRGCCAICGIHESQTEKRLHLDHDHSCCSGRKACGGCVRGLLCAKCNTSIGQFESEPTRLLVAYEYLTGGD